MNKNNYTFLDFTIKLHAKLNEICFLIDEFIIDNLSYSLKQLYLLKITRNVTLRFYQL